jgi:serine/threonine-protein kinase RsbW
MTAELMLDLHADMADLGKADEAVTAMAGRLGWSGEVLFQLRLVLEEIIINVISHGSGDGRRARVRVSLRQDGDVLRLELSDDGIAFNPLSTTPPDVSLDIEDRPIGGLGVHLIRTMMDSISYRREGDWNRLLVTKALGERVGGQTGRS